MHSIVYLTCFLAAFTCTFASDVLVLTDNDFETKIKEYDMILAEFYAPWCGHCKRLAPEFDKAALTLAQNDPPVALAKIDCTVETKTCEKFSISGYPTLKIFKNGEVAEDYNGPRDAAGIATTMRVKAGPAYRVLENSADYEKFLAHNEHSIVGYFDDEKNALVADLVKVAGQLAEKFRFAYTTAKDIVKKAGYKNQIVIHQPQRLQSKLEDAAQVLQATGDDLKAAVFDKIHGLVGHRIQSNAQDYPPHTVVVYYNADYNRDPKGTNYVRNRVLKVAKKLADEGVNVRFAVSNAEEFRQELGLFGVSDVKKEGKYVTAWGPNDKKYRLTEEFSFETLEDFARKLSKGEVEAYLKSQDVPEQTEDVKVVVAKNFDDIVNDNTKDVLIEFYAPWCGHCKSLVPKYEELAKTLKNEDSVVIAKMDATENDVPGQYQVKGYPTIFYAPKDGKDKPKLYEGAREVDDFLKYLAKESTDGLKGYDREGAKKKKSSAGEEL